MERFLIILSGILYGIMGFALDEYKIIVHPAYFALYGYTYGIFISLAVHHLSHKRKRK